MNEQRAKAWLVDALGVSRETIERLEAYIECVQEAQADQNLVSASTLPTFWTRHIIDSAQLVPFSQPGSWLDIGSGAGIPGLITAIISGADTILVEPRARRAAFLAQTADRLQLPRVTVIPSTIQQLAPCTAANITARAVTALPKLIEMAFPFAHKDTVWLLPKGKTAETELASLPRAWQGSWTKQPSVTDRDSFILIGRRVKVMGNR